MKKLSTLLRATWQGELPEHSTRRFFYAYELISFAYVVGIAVCWVVVGVWVLRNF
jgi:hypothetical protein